MIDLKIWNNQLIINAGGDDLECLCGLNKNPLEMSNSIETDIFSITFSNLYIKIYRRLCNDIASLQHYYSSKVTASKCLAYCNVIKL